MAGETTRTPVSADISSTVLSGLKERSTRWIIALTAAPDGFTLADINHRQRLAISLLQLSVDHHVSLRLLIDAEMLPSTRALYRPQSKPTCAGSGPTCAPARHNSSASFKAGRSPASMTRSRHWKHSTTSCGHLSFR